MRLVKIPDQLLADFPRHIRHITLRACNAMHQSLFVIVLSHLVSTLQRWFVPVEECGRKRQSHCKPTARSLNKRVSVGTNC